MSEHPHIRAMRREPVGFEACTRAFGGVLGALDELATCPQDPGWHAEGDVATHTAMVMGEVDAWLGETPHDEEDALALRLGALLHDIAKPRTTTRRTIRGVERVVAPGHAAAGAAYLMHRLVEDELGLDHTMVRRVLALVAYHHDPKMLVVKDRAPSAYMGLSWKANTRDLWALELADMRGRMCEDRDEQIELIELFRLGCEEAGCFGAEGAGWQPFVEHVASALEGEPAHEVERAIAEGVRAYSEGTIYTPEEAVSRSFEGRGERSRVTLTYGPSGSGKSTWAREWARREGAELIRLDAIRAEVRGKEGDQRANSHVLAIARERLKEALRRGDPVVWDATSLRREHRAGVLETARRYGAHTTLAIAHTSVSQGAARNRERREAVPAAVIARQLDGLQFPQLDEAHRVLWIGAEGEIVADTRTRWERMARGESTVS